MYILTSDSRSAEFLPFSRAVTCKAHYMQTFAQSMNQKVISFLSSSRLSWIIIAFGILIRLVQYLYNRSLWADEAVLALNIVNRSYLELLQPLDYDQAAPIGFLIVEKIAVQLFGDNEYSLRLFPLVFGIISLLLFFHLAKRCIPKTAIPIALALFATLPYLVYYACEVKQYSTDVAIALLSCLVAMQLSSPKLNFTQTVTLSLMGAIAIWFSHPAIFVLAGVGITSLLIGSASNKNLKINNLIVFLTWLLSFTGMYFGFLRHLNSDEDLLQSWGQAFPSSPFDIIWLFDAFGKFFYKPLGFSKVIDAIDGFAFVDGIAIFAFVIGCVSCFYRRKDILAILLSPLIVTFVAAYLHKYPFRSRLVLFLTTFIILLIAEGVNFLIKKNRYAVNLVGVLILALLLANPLYNTSISIFNPYLKEEIKHVMSYVKARQQPGDVLYVFQRGRYQFQYYAKKYGYQDGDYIIGVEDLDKYDGKTVSPEEEKRYKSDLDKLRGNKRVWLIFSHADKAQEIDLINAHINKIGKQIDIYSTKGAFVYLYDFSSE